MLRDNKILEKVLDYTYYRYIIDIHYHIIAQICRPYVSQNMWQKNSKVKNAWFGTFSFKNEKKTKYVFGKR